MDIKKLKEQIDKEVQEREEDFEEIKTAYSRVGYAFGVSDGRLQEAQHLQRIIQRFLSEEGDK